MVKISVISPIYNVQKYLPRFFNSLEKQTLIDVEFILVNDGSTDNSLKLCNDFSIKDSRVMIVNQKNQGSGVARNNGLKRASGKYVYFCDPDDYIDKDLLKDNYEIAERNNANVVIFGYVAEDIRGNILSKNKPYSNFYKSKNDFQQEFINLYNQNLLYFVWNKLYLRESVSNLKFEKVRAGQDTRFNLNYYKSIDRVYMNEHIYYHYTVSRPNSAQSQLKIDKALLSVEEIEKLESLYYGYWKKKKNKDFENLIKREYLGVAFFTMKVGKKIKNPCLRNKTMDKVFELPVVKKYLNMDVLNNSFKDNMKIFFIKRRKKAFFWNLYDKLSN